MIIRTDPWTGAIKNMTDKEIKAEIMELKGYTTAEYQKAYDRLRNRVRNYETITGAKKGNIKVNELMLRIARREATGEQLTPQQQAITELTSASPATFRKSYELNKVSQAQEAIARTGVLGTYGGLINKSATTKKALDDYLNEVIAREPMRDNGGRVVYDDNGNVIMVDVLRSARVTAEELDKFLRRQAADLHRRQQAEIENNKSFYSRKRMKPGTD